MNNLSHRHNCFREIPALVGFAVCGIKACTRLNGKLVRMPDELRDVMTTGRRPCLSAMIVEHIVLVQREDEVEKLVQERKFRPAGGDL